MYCVRSAYEQNVYTLIKYMVQVVDLFCGGGGFSAGAIEAGENVILAIELDNKIAKVYSNHFDHSPRIQELGGDIEEITSELKEFGPIHLHGSPPCLKLSQVNQTNRNSEEGLRLVIWYLDLVEIVQPYRWSMEQVAARSLLDLLTQRGIHFCVVDACDFGVPQHRKRVVAGSECIVSALKSRAGKGPTVLPRDVLSLPNNCMLTNGTTNQPIKKREGGKSVSIGLRKMAAGEGARGLDTPCHTVWSKPGAIYDSVSDQEVRKLTCREMASLQGFPATFRLDESVTLSRKCIANAIPPPLARFIVEAGFTA